MEVFRKCEFEGCKKEFFPLRSTQIYCCAECRMKAGTQKKYKKVVDKKPQVQEGPKFCHRSNCKMWSKRLANRCDALVELYEDEMKCKFYKEKK